MICGANHAACTAANTATSVTSEIMTAISENPASPRRVGYRGSVRPLLLTALATALALAAPALPLGPAIASLPLATLLIAVSLADLRRWRIPDAGSAALAATGVLTTAALAPHALAGHVAGALATGALLWSVAEAFRRLRGRDGFGLGDVKLAAAGALWVGPWACPR